MTATTARIRLCSRDVEYATASDASVLAARPDAVDGSDDAMPSFFDVTADASVVLLERFAFQKLDRGVEQAEVDGMLSIGAGVPISPTVPLARMIDADRPLDATMLISGVAIDFNTDRNSIEADG